MSEVKRYDHWVAHADSDDPESWMGESQSGDWVMYEDYAALQQKLDAVVAENVKLKDINAWCKTKAFENMYREFKTAEAIGCPDVDCMHDAMLTALMHAPLTPTTDAVLNEVRAEGVMMFADSAYCSRDQHQYVMQFAAQLRAGSKEGGV
jgi:hypothetical protein